MLQLLEPLLFSKYFWISAILVTLYGYVKFVIFTYWKRHGIPHDPPQLPFGNALPVVLGKKSLGNFVKESYDKFKKFRYHGIYIFHQPLLLINDPELIRHVLIKDFNKFRDRGMYYNEKVDPLSGHLFLLPGEKWRKLRAKLTVTFTSGKLKQMFPLIKEIGDELIKVCDQTITKENIIEFKDLIGRYTTDSISSIAFGFNCKSLEDPDNEFKRYGAMVFDQNPIRNALGAFAPIVLDILQIPLIRKQVIHFFTTTFQDMVKYRRQNNIVRKDFFDLLMQLMDKGKLDEDEKLNETTGKSSDGDKITMVQAQAQAFVFFVAGFETTSSTITYLLYELALNPDIQDKVHLEIDEFFAKGELTYDRVMNELDYLHMTFNETLRKHPSVPFLNRSCLEDWKIPDSNFTIRKGTGVMISVTGLQSDPDIFPNPEKFDPTRFSKENVATRSPYVYLPFGDGPRICIGARFGILQSKIALIALLSNYKFFTCEKTPIPIQYSKRSFTQSPHGGVYLRMERRAKYLYRTVVNKMLELMEVFNSKAFCITLILFLTYLYFKLVVYSYWQKRRIPCDDFSILTGIFGRDFLMQKITVGDVFKRSYEKLKKFPFHGVYVFHNPVLMINDPELIKNILVKDFASFCDRGLYCNPQVDPLSGHLFLLYGDRWRTLRAKLSPTFSAGKLKQMFYILNDITSDMIRVVNDDLINTDILEMKDLVSRYTTDAIFSLAFGVDSKCLKYPNNQFRHYGNLSIENSIVRGAIGFFAPKVLYAFRQPFTNPEVSKYFIKLFQDMVDKRRRENIKRKDFLNSLIDLMDNEQLVDKEMTHSSGISAESIARRLEMVEAAAQAFVFFIGGFETSSSVATHCLYELALNPEIQEKLYNEIKEQSNSSCNLNYENLMQLKYLDMVFLETMRKHPSVPILNRICINDYQIPNSDFTIEKDTGIIISVTGLHSDPNIYHDPEKFDPLRFKKENLEPKNFYAYLAFGEGPRICIGKRLGILQSKMAIYHLLLHYKFSKCDRTSIPIEYNRRSLLQTPRGGIYLKVEKRKVI
ncbi:uncharacterized protein LOC131662839 [Phymastichus coffea]|uniref:uncharacterized protein LOC131662839 n=1 Tax=Phymastichus coffea TaxID=108790 RepID=UPI00273B1554|nr:uncharacterized protein LOC131662839 [Phymastichus coffea]